MDEWYPVHFLCVCRIKRCVFCFVLFLPVNKKFYFNLVSINIFFCESEAILLFQDGELSVPCSLSISHNILEIIK